MKINFVRYCFLLFVFYSCHGQELDVVEIQDFETVENLPVAILKVGNGHYFIDFGRAYFGTVALKSTVAQADSLVIHLGEKLGGKYSVDRKPGGTIRYQEVKMAGIEKNTLTTVALVSDKRNAKPPAILLPKSFGVIIPFRYVEIENLKIPIEDLQIFQKGFHYRFNDDASHFKSSSIVLDSIWDLCKHTIKATSFTGLYVDGDRERIPYEADAFINQLSHYSFDNEYDMARNTNAYFINNPTWPTEWLLHTVMLFYHDYMYTGDLEVLEENYEALKLKTLIDLQREDGLISSKSEKMNADLMLKLGFKNTDKKIRDIVDWPPAQKDTGWKLKTEEGERDGYELMPINTVVNAFYYHNLQLMGEIAGFLNKPTEVIFWEGKSKLVKQTINTKLFDEQKGVYIDGEGSTHASLHANMFPLAFDLVPKAHLSSVTEFIKTRGMACSVYGAQYLLEGLYKNGETAYAKQLLTDTISNRSWWNMIKIGSTMTLEAWDSDYKPNLDWNHAWGAAPANIITRYLWGVTPSTPGFEIARIQPRLSDFNFSEIKVPTKLGAIEAKYNRADSKEVFEIYLPTSMKAFFILPEQYKDALLNGERIRGKPSQLKLDQSFNSIEVRF